MLLLANHSMFGLEKKAELLELSSSGELLSAHELNIKSDDTKDTAGIVMSRHGELLRI